MAFTIKGLVSDGTLPTSAKADLSSDLANSTSTVGKAVADKFATKTEAVAKDADVAALVQNPSTTTGAAVKSMVSSQTAHANRPAYPLADWVHWGDSLTASTWPTKLATYTSRNHVNAGWGGQEPFQIAARQGGIPALVTVTGGSIPASGAVGITVTNLPLGDGGSRKGILAGVPGSMSRAGSAYSFTREVSGLAVPVPANTPFFFEEGEANRDRTATIWVGRNGALWLQHTDIVNHVREMIEHLSPVFKRVLVLEVPPKDTEINGNADRTKVNALNTLLRDTFPQYWFPISTMLRSQAAFDILRMTPTAQDTTDMGNGVTPISFRSDSIHLNTAGNDYVAYAVAVEAHRRGWIATAPAAPTPPVPPATPVTHTAGADGVTHRYAAQTLSTYSVTSLSDEVGTASLVASGSPAARTYMDGDLKMLRLPARTAAGQIRASGLDSGSLFTFSVLMRAATGADERTGFSVDGYSIGRAGSGQYGLRGTGSGRILTGVNDANWHVLTARVDNATPANTAFWIDGVKQLNTNSITGPNTDFTDVLQFGGMATTSVHDLLEVNTWGALLTDQQIADHYAAMKARYSTIGLV